MMQSNRSISADHYRSKKTLVMLDRRADLDRFLNANTVEISAGSDKPKSRVSELRSKAAVPIERSIGFAEVQIVERNTRKKTVADSNAAGQEVILPSGITLRLAPGGSLDFLSSVISAP